jgi:hypothetical protein
MISLPILFEFATLHCTEFVPLLTLIKIVSIAPERHLEDDRPRFREVDFPVGTDRTSLRKLIQKLRVAEVLLGNQGEILSTEYLILVNLLV